MSRPLRSEYPDWNYHVIALHADGIRIAEYLALANSVTVARAAFFAVLPERAGVVVQVLQRQRIVYDSREDAPVMASGT